MSNIFPLSEYGIQQSIILLSRTIRNWIDDNVAYIKQLDKNYQTLNKVTKPGLYYLRGTESGSPSQLAGEGLLVVINHGRYPIELTSEELYCKDLQLVIDYSTLDFMFRVKDGQDKEFTADWSYKLMGQRGGEGDQSTVTGVGSRALTYASYGGGVNSIAGCYCFTISRDETKSFDHVYEGNTYGVYKLDSIIGIEAGDTISLQLNYVKDFYATVLAVTGDSNDQAYGITLKSNQILIDKEIYKNDQYVPEEHGEPTLWLPYKPTVGTMPLGQSQAVFGTDCIASGQESFATGLRSKALSKYAFAWGRDGVAAYASMAGGRECQATGESSFAVGHRTAAKAYAAHATGNNTQALGNSSHAGGNSSIARGTTSFAHGSKCEAIGIISFATGQGTKATASTQFVAGSYNTIRDDAALIIGNGSKDSSRSNAFVITKDGSGELSKQGTSANSIVIRDTLNKVVKQCGIQEIKTADDVLAIDPAISVSEEFLISASNSGEIKKFGTNLLKTNKTYNAYGIVTELDPSEPSGIIISGTAERNLSEVQAAYYSIYLPKGHYTFFIEGLDPKHSSDNVYFRLLGITDAGESELVRVDNINTAAEFDILETVGKIKIKTVIQTGESFVDEHIRFQLQVGGKTEFTSYKKPTTIELVAKEETIMVVDDLTPFTLVSQTDDNTLTCKYSVSTKDYIDSNSNSNSNSGSGSKAKSFTVNVGTDWVTDEIKGGYHQTIAVDGILSTDDPIADVKLSDDIDANTLYLKAWEKITRIVTSDNTITLYANKSAPTSAFTIKLKVVR